jgi:hypothetical protein
MRKEGRFRPKWYYHLTSTTVRREVHQTETLCVGVHTVKLKSQS